MPATLADIQRKYGESVYPLFKDEMYEPYMETNNGIGYKGVVLYDELEDKIQCSVCGKWFRRLSSHLKIHKINTEEYRKENGLNLRTPLCSKEQSSFYSKNGKESWKKNKKKIIRQLRRNAILNKDKRVKEKISKRVKISASSVMYKNRYGLCDAQMVARLVIVRDMCGKKDLSDVSVHYLRTHDYALWKAFIKEYGSYSLARKALGLKRWYKKIFSDATLIAGLRLFVKKEKREPMTTDLGGGEKNKNGLATQETYRKYFGSWRRAKMMAGLKQLLNNM